MCVSTQQSHNISPDVEDRVSVLGAETLLSAANSNVLKHLKTGTTNSSVLLSFSGALIRLKASVASRCVASATDLGSAPGFISRTFVREAAESELTLPER